MYYYGNYYSYPPQSSYLQHQYYQPTYHDEYDVDRQQGQFQQFQSFTRRINELERRVNQLNREVNQLQQTSERHTRRLNRLNQRLRVVEQRLHIPFSSQDEGF
ncbi:hypothetical protein CN514_13195 [Bacillus sp. AFS001701]|uniref:hypothetical protein n=1 Tax=Bacillaceae TaxID=186817 RepID=UPI000BF97DE6|nr:hypothetical protein [Bacillus sp. AFS001701]PET63975.1 hypothetical protein CN514_13195 [Bacillus sp. AFS001701]